MNCKDVFIHPSGICESETIGKGSKVWAFAHILPQAIIGSDCNVCDHVFIENDVEIGDRVTIKCGVQLWDGIDIENDVFIGPNATFTNDLFPRSKHYQEKTERTLIETGASIGANATILCGITVGRDAMVGAGAVVTKSIPPNAIVMGNPARITGYVNTPKVTTTNNISVKDGDVSTINIDVQGVELRLMTNVQDLRGSLSAGEVNSQIPFEVSRYFLVYDVTGEEIRGEHAHKKCHQFLVCVKGTCSVVVDDGESRQEILLDKPEVGLYLPPMVWGVQYKYTSDGVLLVMASDFYDPNDYVRDYQEFLTLRAQIISEK